MGISYSSATALLLKLWFFIWNSWLQLIWMRLGSKRKQSEHEKIGKAGREPEFHDVKLWSLFFLSSGFDT